MNGPGRIPSLIYEVLDRDAVYDTVFENSTPATIFRIGKTCHAARRAMQDYVGRTFNINQHFERFFTDPFEFRVLQARTGLVVSGSSALQFMDRTVYPCSDLDLYIAEDCATLVCDWICSEGGRQYHFVPSVRQVQRGILTVQNALRSYMLRGQDINEHEELWHFYDKCRIKQVFNFESVDQPNLHVQVIVSQNTPMDCILGFHSSE